MCESHKRLGTRKESTAVMDRARDLHEPLIGETFSLDRLPAALDDMSLNAMKKLEELIAARRKKLEATKSVVLDAASELSDAEKERIEEGIKEVKKNIVDILGEFRPNKLLERYPAKGRRKKGPARPALLELAERLQIKVKPTQRIRFLKEIILERLKTILSDDQMGLIPELLK